MKQFIQLVQLTPEELSYLVWNDKNYFNKQIIYYNCSVLLKLYFMWFFATTQIVNVLTAVLLLLLLLLLRNEIVFVETALLAGPQSKSIQCAKFMTSSYGSFRP